ncbi:acyltransferase family protein [Dyadobacter sp. CY312]|uniref:acyltransferase family protein n=1 Tax=Dyadobacter sp. CY312 TaxID=2907303 RepID=UPI001F297FF8|nr:heparan-alpha-glucosaminide N-acetyltransferase domain-containing protein [Dyadobacter sp. CY312]MCE7043644.1 heparan-alpha-glucosaminide N-acetyltransferase domain-containing protein [Dyadobacter sp. CY312]
MDISPKAPIRLISLDAMRGFTIAAMIMVNFPGDEQHVFPTLQHTKWNGLTFTDLIAPVFLFIVGVSIAFAYSRRLTEHKPALYKKIAIRSVKIFAVGMFLNMLPYFDFSDLRYTGTLHRIAIVFFFCAVLFLNTNWKQQAITGAIILIVYWLAMMLIPTPGMGQVMLEPGKNLAAWIDQQFLPGKMWQGNWDPEGILSTFPATVSGISGMLAGRLLLSDLTPERKTNYLMAAGLLAASAGYFCGLVFPVNENLWTSSFVLVTSGFACMLLGAMYFVIDILGKKRGTSFGIIFGANAIAAYVLADILALILYISHFGEKTLNQHVVDTFITAGVEPRLASWFYALIFVGINFIPVWLLYRRKIFIKL